MAQLVETDVLDVDRSLRQTVRAAVDCSGGRDLVQGGQAVRLDGAEDGEARRELRVLVHQEELAAIGTRATVRHCNRAPGIGDQFFQLWASVGVLVRWVLVGELIAGTAGAIALRVT